MYDGWTSLISEELLAQAVRVDGILYLRAYGLLEEILTFVVPFFVLSLFIAGCCVLGDFLACVILRLISAVRNKKSQG
jgi:hypothetical protein